MSDLIVLDGLNLVDLFTKKGLNEILDRIEVDVKSIATDASTKKGRDEIASLAYKVSRSKTTMDDAGKSVTDEWKKQSSVVDAARRDMRDRMDKLKEEVRKPLTDFENAEKHRVSTLKGRIQYIEGLMIGGNTQEEIKSRLSKAEAVEMTGWQEFEELAISAKKKTIENLTAELQNRIKYDEDQAELVRLREEAAQRDQKERERKIADVAAEKGRKEAEDEAAAERQRLVDEKVAAERELNRQAELKRQEDATNAAREADNVHRAKINSQALDSLINRFDPPIEAQRAREIIEAIVRGEIINIKITY